LRQLFVILNKEAQVLIANINVRVTAEQPVLFLRLPTPAEPMAVDLIFDLIGRVAHVYARVDVRGAHLCLGALKSGEELRVQLRRLGVPQFLRNVARKAEIGILVDGAGDETGDVRCRAKYLREGVGK
jgi:hypothetical protein